MAIIADLKQMTLEALRRGIANSDEIREWITSELGTTITSRFINEHAWALVHLQRENQIEKVSKGIYRLNEFASPDHTVSEPTKRMMPEWARRLINGARSRNIEGCSPFTEDDLVFLWKECGGRCSVTGLPFSLETIGNGKAKRPYAPSLDRIQPRGCYSRENCRLVLVGVNFAMNSWGLDTYLMLAEAAVQFQQQPAIDER